MKSLQWGIIGCGDVTEKKSGPAFNKVHRSSLVAVMRRDELKVKDYAKRHHVPFWYTDARQLINDERVNAIYVATPPAFHEEYTIMALNAGKPVYVEKPMALDLSSSWRMRDSSEKAGVKLSVAHYRRQQPLFIKIKKLMEDGLIGRPQMANLQLFQTAHPGLVAKSEVNWRIDPAISGGGLFYDLAPHQLDLMLYFFGSPLSASGISTNHSASYEVDDFVTGHIHFKNNVGFSGTWSFSVSETEVRDHCEIIGTEGSIRFSIFQAGTLTHVQHGKIETYDFDPLEHVQQPMIEAVVRYFLDEGSNPCSADEGVETMWLLEAFTRKK